MTNVDETGRQVLPGWPGLERGDVHIQDQDVEEDGEHRHDCPTPERKPDPPWLAGLGGWHD